MVAAKERRDKEGVPSAAIELADGTIITATTSEVDRKIFKKLGIGLTSEPVRKD